MTFFVEGHPKPQPRPRAYRSGRGIRMYNPASANVWRAAVQLASAKSGETFGGDLVRVELTFYMPRPQAHYRGTGKNKPRELCHNAPKSCGTKPDVDNLIKSTLDAMTDAGLWDDDKQVVEIRAEKLYANDAPGCAVTVDAITKNKNKEDTLCR